MANGKTPRHRSRTVLVALAVASGIALLPVSPAAAHLHGITPLRCVGTANDGANQTDATPASAANGGPISGLIECAHRVSGPDGLGHRRTLGERRGS